MVLENMILAQRAAKGMTVGEMTGLLSQNEIGRASCRERV